MNTLKSTIATVIMLASAGLFVASCASTKMTDSWTSNRLENAPYRNLLIIGIGEQEHHRRLFEDHFVEELKMSGIGAERSYPLLPDSKDIDRDSVAAAIEGRNIDAVLVTHMVSIEKETIYRQRMDYMPTQGYYNGLYNYYPEVHTYVNRPGYYTTHDVVKLETNVYDVATEEIVWSAHSRSFAPESANEVINELTTLLIRDMAAKGIIKKK